MEDEEQKNHLPKFLGSSNENYQKFQDFPTAVIPRPYNTNISGNSKIESYNIVLDKIIDEKEENQEEIFRKIEVNDESEEEDSIQRQQNKFQSIPVKLEEIGKRIITNPIPNLLIKKTKWETEDLYYPIFGVNVPSPHVQIIPDDYEYYKFLIKSANEFRE